MTETKPQEAQLPALRPDSRVEELREVGRWLAAAESGNAVDPKIVGATAAWRLYLADALGLSPLAALEVAVIKGHVFIQAQLLRALAEREGYRVRRVEEQTNAKQCVAAISRQGEELGRATYTLAMAEQAGLASKDNWKKNPARMLWARASSLAVRDFAPAVALGLYTVEEAEEFDGIDLEPSGERYEPEPSDQTEDYEDRSDFGPPESEAGQTTLDPGNPGR